MYCVLCRKNKEAEDFYKSHKLRDENGFITCPVLRRYTCPKCQAIGQHTLSYCPENKKPANNSNSITKNKSINNKKKVRSGQYQYQQYQQQQQRPEPPARQQPIGPPTRQQPIGTPARQQLRQQPPIGTPVKQLPIEPPVKQLPIGTPPKQQLQPPTVGMPTRQQQECPQQKWVARVMSPDRVFYLVFECSHISLYPLDTLPSEQLN